MNHKDRFYFPDDDIEISSDAKDLISRLICDRQERFGQKGLADFKAHPFLCTIDWDNIREQPAPFIPEIENETDTSNFDPDLDDGPKAGFHNDSSMSEFSYRIHTLMPFYMSILLKPF